MSKQKLLSMFKHIKAGTLYITIPSKSANSPFSPIKGVKNAKLLMYYIVGDKIINPETGEQVGIAKIDGVDSGNGMLLFVVKEVFDKKAIEKHMKRSILAMLQL